MRAVKIVFILVAFVLLLAACNSENRGPATLVATVASAVGDEELAADESPRSEDSAPSSRIPPTWTPAPAGQGAGGVVGAGTQPGASTPTPDETYVVQPGDTLAEIAEELGVDLQRLASANNIQNIDLIFSGQILTVPR